MKKERGLNRSSLTLGLALAAVALLFFSTGTPAAHLAAPQGKGGTIKPASTPTPAPKKTTPPKRSAASSGRAGSAKPAGNGNTGKADAAANERVFWESMRNSTDPEDYREYLRKYPNGEFAGLAKNRLKAMEASQPQPAATTDAAKGKTPANTSGINVKPNDMSGSSNTAPTVTPSAGGAKPTPKPGTVLKNSIGMELVWIPSGSFMMGSENGRDNEKPVHQVTIKEGFYMGKYEVTQAQWQKVMGSNPSNFKGESLPVEKVSWLDAQEFISKLNAMNDGYTYRLPAESEWEYAGRAGTTGDYAGDLDSMAWYVNNAGRKYLDPGAMLREKGNYLERVRENGNQTHPVGQKQPNGFGLYDMHGNVWEWCQDWSHDDYNGGAPTDGSAWLSGGGQRMRVLRGGSWGDLAERCRSASRDYLPSDFVIDSFGLRVVAVARTQ